MSITNTFTSNTPITAAIGPQNVEKRYMATEAQIEVWLSSMQSVEANCAYNEIASLLFDGDLDTDQLHQSIDKVVQRHGSLRSTFSEDGQQVIVRESVNYAYERRDFRSRLTVELDKALQEVIIDQACTPFDLFNGPLFRVVHQQISDTKHKLTIAAHHLVLDGWSLAVFCKDLGHYYGTLSGTKRDPLPPVNHYHEYAEKMHAHFQSAAGKSDEQFWIEQFSDCIPVLDLPAEMKRPAIRSYFGHRYDHQLSSELVECVRKVGAKAGCSLFNVLLAAFNAYISRISGNDDFCIGIPTAGQAAMDQLELMGHCVNTMPLRTKVDVEQPFNDYMKASRSTLLDAFDHQCYSYGTLLRKLAPPRDPTRPPMLSVSFNIDPMIDANELGFGEIDVELLVEPRKFENFEWFINGVIQKDKSIQMQVQYNSDLYSTHSMKFYFEGFEAFLEGIANDPQVRIADLQLMSIPQRQKVIVDWNATQLDYPVDALLHTEFSRQAAETPEKTAVVFEDESLTYAEVESRSNQFARYLRTQGVEAGDLVGICVDRSAQMLVNLYGIMKAGAGYVPLDPAYPSDRLQYMCDHSGLKLIVTESQLTSRVSEFNKPQLDIDSSTNEINALDSAPIENTASPASICYVIYTSGSTGKPKGVQVPHGAVVNFLYAMQHTPGFGPDDSSLAVTTLSFDIAVLELYLPTISGGKVVIVDSLTATDGVKLAEQLTKHDISLLQATPATWRMLLQADWDGKCDLKVLCGGEPMPQDLVAPLLERCGELWNMYGPTETTVWSAAFQITDAVAPILIGTPVGNTQIYILDANGNEVPVGCEGEVFIGGAGVTLGYRSQSEMTDERFIKNRYRNPFVDYVSDRLYKTGDLARYRFDGNIEFLRRNDKQVKVRGFRIELGEIEQNIKSHPAVEHNVVVVREDTTGDARLVAYLIMKSDQQATAGQLRDHLKASVPYYMVPQHFVTLDKMPQTNNGKIDYKSLPSPSAETSQTAATDVVAMPETAGEKWLAGVWESILEIDDVCLNDTFFDIGGHSLLVMRVIKSVNDKTSVKLGPQEFLMSTLEQMANRISDSFEFEVIDDSTTAEPEPTTVIQSSALEENNKTENEKTESESSGAFRLLKGFWN